MPLHEYDSPVELLTRTGEIDQICHCHDLLTEYIILEFNFFHILFKGCTFVQRQF